MTVKNGTTEKHRADEAKIGTRIAEMAITLHRNERKRNRTSESERTQNLSFGARLASIWRRGIWPIPRRLLTPQSSLATAAGMVAKVGSSVANPRVGGTH
jgi:hypothetical protein